MNYQQYFFGYINCFISQ